MYAAPVHAARELWDYFASFSQVAQSDAIVVCCSYDLRVADYAVELARAGVAPTVVFSGNRGNWTAQLWSAPEARLFAERALRLGLPAERIVVEERAENIGQNVRYSLEALADRKPRRVLFLTKPNTLLRVRLTVPVIAPGLAYAVAGPGHAFPDEVSPVVGLLGVMDELVGDVERILAYPRRGFQVAHPLPPAVLAAYRLLRERGFTRHCLPDEPA